jgi:hypothetical protein
MGDPRTMKLQISPDEPGPAWGRSQDNSRGDAEKVGAATAPQGLSVPAPRPPRYNSLRENDLCSAVGKIWKWSSKGVGSSI